MLWLSAHVGMMGTAFVIKRILDELEPRQSQLIERSASAPNLLLMVIIVPSRPLRSAVELAHIDRSGEGILPSLVSLIRRCAVSRNLEETEWLE